jgi:hypothetical protein
MEWAQAFQTIAYALSAVLGASAAVIGSIAALIRAQTKKKSPLHYGAAYCEVQ